MRYITRSRRSKDSFSRPVGRRLQKHDRRSLAASAALATRGAPTSRTKRWTPSVARPHGKQSLARTSKEERVVGPKDDFELTSTR